MTGDLVALDIVKTYLGIAVTTSDAKLSELITECSAWIKSYLNRDILQAQYTEVLNGTGTRQIMLANYPATAIESVTINGTDQTANIICDGRRTLTLTTGNGVFTNDLMNVIATYTAGYVTVPSDLVGVAVKMVAWGYTESSRIQQKSKSMGGEVVTFDTGSAPQWAIQNLNNYRKVIG